MWEQFDHAIRRSNGEVARIRISQPRGHDDRRGIERAGSQHTAATPREERREGAARLSVSFADLPFADPAFISRAFTAQVSQVGLSQVGFHGSDSRKLGFRRSGFHKLGFCRSGFRRSILHRAGSRRSILHRAGSRGSSFRRSGFCGGEDSAAAGQVGDQQIAAVHHEHQHGCQGDGALDRYAHRREQLVGEHAHRASRVAERQH